MVKCKGESGQRPVAQGKQINLTILPKKPLESFNTGKTYLKTENDEMQIAISIKIIIFIKLQHFLPYIDKIMYAPS